MTDELTMDRGSGVALWRQIAEKMRSEIVSGQFPEGTRLPTEKDLAERFGVNRHTVRRSIAALTQSGLLRADQGRGTFVATNLIRYPIGPRTRFSEIIAGQSQEFGGRLVGSTHEEADIFLAEQLGVVPGTMLVRLDTLNVVDGAPLTLANNWFEQARFPRLVADYAETGSITKALAAAGVTDYRRKETRITAEIVDLQDAALLELAPDQPVMVVEAVNVDTNEQPNHFTRGRLAASRVKLIVES